MDYVKENGKWKMSRLGFIPHISLGEAGPPSEDTFLNFLDEAQKTMREQKK